MPPRHPDVAVEAPEEIVVYEKRVACDGGGTLGHPLVYMEMGDENSIDCSYCDRRFVLSADHHAESEYLSPAARPPEAH